MPGHRNKRFTIYDMMEEKGVFTSNPANAHSMNEQDGTSLYAGPVEFPKMLYHPLGAEQVIVPAEVIVTPLGPKSVGEQRQIIYQVVTDAGTERRLLAEGWHTHPARAMAAAGREAPAVSSAQVIADLEAKIAQLQNERNTAHAHQLADAKPSGSARRASPPAADLA